MRPLARLALTLIALLSPVSLDAQGVGARRAAVRLSVGTAHAQSGEPVARRFDEFTSGSGSLESRTRWFDEKREMRELRGRFALYAAELRRVGARPYAITYSPRVVEWEVYGRSIARARASSLWFYLTPLGFDWRNINWVDGGFRDVATTELWIVPPGAQPPCPTPTVRSEDVEYCPRVSVAAPYYVPDGRRLQFTASVSVNLVKLQPTFTWEVSRGRIVGGQGTDKIEVEEPEGSSGEVLAKVTAHGYSLECPEGSTTATARTTFGTSHFKLDSFGKINCEDEAARLDNLAIELQNRPSLQVHVVFYGGRIGPRNEALARASRMKAYLVESRGIDASRVIMIDGGYRGDTEGEIWLSLAGTGAPPLRPTIEEKYVKFKGRLNVPSAPCNFDYLGR
jgi:hypothetical protein